MEPTVLSGVVQNTSDSCWKSMTEGGQWILVIDTNVYISALPFVERVRDTNVPGKHFLFSSYLRSVYNY